MRVRLPSSLRKLTGGKAVVEQSAATVGALFEALEADFPGFKDRLCEPDGRLKRHINVFVNGKDIRSVQDMQTPLAEGDEVIIAPAIAGG